MDLPSDPEIIKALEPEELAAHLLVHLYEHQRDDKGINWSNLNHSTILALLPELPRRERNDLGS